MSLYIPTLFLFSTLLLLMVNYLVILEDDDPVARELSNLAKQEVHQLEIEIQNKEEQVSINMILLSPISRSRHLKPFLLQSQSCTYMYYSTCTLLRFNIAFHAILLFCTAVVGHTATGICLK